MNWLKQNWVLVGLGVFISGILLMTKVYNDKSISMALLETITIFPPAPSSTSVASEDEKVNNKLFEFDWWCPEMELADSPYSHNGKLIAEGGVKDNKSFLVVKNRNDGTTIIQLEERITTDPTTNLSGFWSPRFSLDDKKLYFRSSGWVQTTGIHELDIATGKVRFITDGDYFLVVPTGKYAGKLIVNKVKYFLGGGGYYFYWLINPETREELGTAGMTKYDSDKDRQIDTLSDFIDLYICKLSLNYK